MRPRLARDAVWQWKNPEARYWVGNVAKAQIFCKLFHGVRHRQRALPHKSFIRASAMFEHALFLWQYDCCFERAHPFPALPG